MSALIDGATVSTLSISLAEELPSPSFDKPIVRGVDARDKKALQGSLVSDGGNAVMVGAPYLLILLLLVGLLN